MRLAAAVLIVAAAALRGATVGKSFREGNSLFLQLSDGTAQVEWLSAASFRFSRRWEGAFVRGPAANPEQVSFKVSETADTLKVATKYLLLTIARRGAMVRVAEPDDTTIMADASEAEMRGGVVSWERAAPPQVRFYGLGAREDPEVELRGSRTTAAKPFLISSAGYGEFHVAKGTYSFDLARAKADRYRIEARDAGRVDYYFFFGPTPKEILEQYLLLDGPMERLSPGKFQLLPPVGDSAGSGNSG